MNLFPYANENKHALSLPSRLYHTPTIVDVIELLEHCRNVDSPEEKSKSVLEWVVDNNLGF